MLEERGQKGEAEDDPSTCIGPDKDRFCEPCFLFHCRVVASDVEGEDGGRDEQHCPFAHIHPVGQLLWFEVAQLAIHADPQDERVPSDVVVVGEDPEEENEVAVLEFDRRVKGEALKLGKALDDLNGSPGCPDEDEERCGAEDVTSDHLGARDLNLACGGSSHCFLQCPMYLGWYAG